MTDTLRITPPSPNECFAAAAKELRDGNIETAREWRQLGVDLAQYIRIGGA